MATYSQMFRVYRPRQLPKVVKKKNSFGIIEEAFQISNQVLFE